MKKLICAILVLCTLTATLASCAAPGKSEDAGNLYPSFDAEDELQGGELQDGESFAENPFVATQE